MPPSGLCKVGADYEVVESIAIDIADCAHRGARVVLEHGTDEHEADASVATIGARQALEREDGRKVAYIAVSRPNTT